MLHPQQGIECAAEDGAEMCYSMKPHESASRQEAHKQFVAIRLVIVRLVIVRFVLVRLVLVHPEAGLVSRSLL